MKSNSKFKSTVALPSYTSSSAMRHLFLSPTTRLGIPAKAKGSVKPRCSEKIEDIPKRGHQKSISNNFHSERPEMPKHGRSQTICNVDLDKPFENTKFSARVTAPVARPLTNFTKKARPKPLIFANPPKDNSRLGKTLKRGSSKRQVEPPTRQGFFSKSPPHPKPGPPSEKIVITNNINIKIDYYDNKTQTPVVVSPANSRPVDPRRAEFSSQLKKETAPRLVQLSLSQASSPRKKPPIGAELPGCRANLGKLFVDLRIDCQPKPKESLKKNVSPRNPAKPSHAKSRTQLFSPIVHSPSSKLTHPSNRKSWANLLDKPTSPSNKLSKKTLFTNQVKAPKPPVFKARHRKNALSAQPASLNAFVKKLKLPIRLDGNRRPALTPEPSERGSLNPPTKNRDIIFQASQLSRENFTHSSNKNNQEMSLRSFRQNTNPELADPEEPEQSLSSDRKTERGYQVSDSVIIHDDSGFKNTLVDQIHQHTIDTGKVKSTSLDFYHIVKPLGEGSYGKVYLAVSVLTKLPVAIKCYDRSKIKTETTCKRILQEIDILKELNHPNVIRFVEIFENSKYIFLVLEYADRDDLLKYLKNHGRFSEADFLPILAQILNGLQYLHDSSILHRDIKLDNILLTSTGQVKICDFGVSRKILSKGLIHEHIGTPAYLAPEIVTGRGYSGFKADIWSLGVLTFIALLGVAPFKGEVIEELNESILNSEPCFPPSADLSPAMRIAILGMLEKNPKKRLSMAQLSSLLKIEVEDSKNVPPRPPINSKRIAKLRSLGFSESQVLASIKSGTVNHVTAINAILDIHTA